jgi:DNA-binding NtrC family response regulator
MENHPHITQEETMTRIRGVWHWQRMVSTHLPWALTQAGGNKSRAADLLRLTRHTLLYRLEKYQIEEG